MRISAWRYLILLAALLSACEQAVATPAPRGRAFPTALPLALTAVPTMLPVSVVPTPTAVAIAPLPDGWREWLAGHAQPLALDPASGTADLAALKSLIGDARVVVVGEPAHGAHEFAQFRGRLLSLLAGEMGFTTVVLDAPWGDVAPLNDYVVDSRGDPQRLLGRLADGWNSDETLSLLAWLNAFNRAARGTGQVRLAGMRAGLPAAAMDMVEEFFAGRGDAAALRQARSRFACLRPYARIGTGYYSLPDQVTSDCRADLQSVLDDLRTNESHHSDPDAYAQALIGARVVLQGEDLLMLEAGLGAAALDARYAAENILSMLGPGERAVVWVQTAQANLTMEDPKSVAALLREKLGDGVRSMAFSMLRGRFVATPSVLESPGVRNASLPPSGSYEKLFGEGAGKSFWLNLRDPSAGDPGAAWLTVPRLFRAAGADYDESRPGTHFTPLTLSRSFDAVFFVPEVTPVLTLYSGVSLSSPFGPPRNLDIEEGGAGWASFGALPAGYAFTIDRNAPPQGLQSLRLSYTAATAPAGRAMIGQTINALRYRGQRLRVSALLRTEDVTSGAGLAVTMVPLRAATFALIVRDSMEGRALHGAQAWQRQSVVVDVPNTEMSLAFGVWLDGPGSVWLDDVQIETVGMDVPVTYALGLPAQPGNLDFAAGTAGWMLDAIRQSDWTFGVEPGAHNGAPAFRLSAQAARPSGGGIVQQLLSAEAYRGKRVQLSGMLHSAAVGGRAGLSLSASSQRMVWNAPNPPRISGTTNWTPVSVSFDVPDSAEMLRLQLSLDGPGQFWISGLRFEVVTP
ncbi:MAG: erythromycin esterase family protein [Chloroflexi bacterium]|nr:erythromycin esterase family protein [Chloroflexota bacterium]